MLARTARPRIPLPKGWPESVQSAVIYTIALTHYAIVCARGRATDSILVSVRLAAENDRLREERALSREEIRIKDARMLATAPHRRPHYGPRERMAILELRAARGWSVKQIADTFFLTPVTIASWIKRIDAGGPEALLRLREPVNKYPDFVRYMVQRLKILCPAMGKVKMAETLCRAGLHLGVTTVGRILKESPHPPPIPDNKVTGHVVTAKRPHHVWHVDLTVVPTSAGLWTAWIPFALPQCWPFCWWVAVALDHYSRCATGFAVFKHSPTSMAVQCFLTNVIQNNGATPKYVISDKGKQFWCDAFKGWCRRHHIKPRYGAVGQKGSIAVVERFILTLKNECTSLVLVPLTQAALQAELGSFTTWYHQHRPHSGLAGRTPDEVVHGRSPACLRPQFEPRVRWPRAARCANPQAPISGPCGVQVRLDVQYYAGRKHLPIVELARAA